MTQKGRRCGKGKREEKIVLPKGGKLEMKMEQAVLLLHNSFHKINSLFFFIHFNFCEYQLLKQSMSLKVKGTYTQSAQLLSNLFK